MKRGKIRSDQITPKGVRALNLASSEGNIWKHLLIGKQNRWPPSTANRTIDQLAEARYIASAPATTSHLRSNFVLTERGALVASKLRVASQGMRVPGFAVNLGGGEFVLTLSNLAFGMASGAYISCPTGQNQFRVASTKGDPVLGIGAKICPRCGEVSANIWTCDTCGALF